MRCEFCDRTIFESLQIVFDKWACPTCYRNKKYIENSIEISKSCKANCRCHACIIAIEMGLKTYKGE